MKKIELLIVAILASISGFAQEPTFEWAKQMGGSDDDYVRSITTDASGNVYTTGYFEGTADFDPGVDTFNLTSAGAQDIFIQKLDANGDFVWAKQMGGIYYDNSYSITTDASGNVYTTGSFQETVDFDPGEGTAHLISIGDQSIFIQKLDANGDFVWVKRIGGSNNAISYSITTDASGNVYTTGSFQGTVDFDTGVNAFNLTSAGLYDVFIHKLDADGDFVWVKQMGGSNNDISYSITTDASGNVYTTGYFQGTADFDPGSDTVNLTSAGLYDVFIHKLDANGDFVWAKQIGGTGYDSGYSITTDASGNVYTTGVFFGTADLDPGVGTVNLTSSGDYDVYIQKLDVNGDFVWAKQIGGSDRDFAYSITTDALGNVYTTGYFSATADLDPGVGTVNLTSSGDYDVYIQKLDANGDFVWAKQMGGTGTDYGYSITTDASGNVYTTGYFGETADFDPGVDTVNLISAGSRDVFIQKLSQEQSLGFDENVTIFSIYPNPTNSKVVVDMMEEPVSYQLFTIDGRLVVSQGGMTSNQFEIDLSNQENGIYWLKISTKDQIQTLKLMKQ